MLITTSDVGICFSAGDTKTWALRHVSLSVEAGQVIMIFGPSGSGKSSLLYLLSGMRPASEGEVRYEGRLLSGRNSRQVRQLRFTDFGFVFQQHFLVGYLTAVENVCAGRSHRYFERACNLLKELGLADKTNAYPAQLSYGQRQRVALARALVHSPKVVFADEPTASVDSDMSIEICQILSDYCDQGGSCVMVTHDMALKTYADVVYSMRDGVLKPDTVCAGE
ncbi:MAG: ABC transporter ATP-binding protein [Firmicutes bacterium]|nr:ABC transporter ATP-binding protein [Bacillota bacterium]MDD4336898.1 ABC transporter ATP-binding protein [Bacillota bacterium]MDD4791451.1 ABC transporter ATP-binding protein [Bacillota bacterium]